MMAASPECTHHSNANGGRPKNDQSRATAWHVCRWAADLTIDNIFIENVREFMDWGPINARGKPVKSRKGETFRAFIQALQSMNYRIEWRVQNAAEFGDPTNRKRLIILAKRGDKAITWPDTTHGPGKMPFHTARECIDWDLPSKSIFNRKKPLSKNTLRRIEAGLRKFGGPNAEPFLVMLYGTNKTRSLDRPMPTITSGGNHTALAEPFLTKYYGTGGARSVNLPFDTVTTKDRFLLVEPVTGQFVSEMDIRLRMLQPHELSAAMSFPKNFRFCGTRANQVKQIGNAVPVELARAHAMALLGEYRSGSAGHYSTEEVAIVSDQTQQKARLPFESRALERFRQD
jgi:DNA (cytosine-5)-methyltransferase 1